MPWSKAANPEVAQMVPIDVPTLWPRLAKSDSIRANMGNSLSL